MEVMTEEKKWFKRTEVGLIPEDWELIKLSDYTSKIGSGITPRGGKKVYQNYGRPFVRSQNIGWGKLQLDDLAFIDDEIHASFDSTEIQKNDVLLNITGASIGRSALAKLKIVGGNVNQHVCIIRTIKNRIEPKFLNLILLSEIGQKQIDSYQAGGNREGLNFGQIGSFQIPLPPTLAEQQAIASALSDVDELIRSLDGLIQKKEAIKKGTMHQLLSGKKRLPGFDGEWIEVNIGKDASLKARIGWQGLRTDEYLDNGEYYLVTGTDFKNGRVDWKGCHYVEYDRFKQDTNIQLKEGDVLVTKDGTIGKVAIVEELNKPATLNSGVFVIRPTTNKFVNEFLFYTLSSIHFTKFLDSLTAGSTINHLYQKDFVTYAFEVPPTIKEQETIAQTLSDMDRELQALRQKREKYEQVKQGMMQELLTGRVRLI